MADLITAKEAGRLLRRSPRTVIRWADQDRLPVAHKVPGDTGPYLFDRSDVERLRDELDAKYDEGAA